MTSEWPSVDVLIPTHDRPELLREAIAAVREQSYPGRLGVLVIFDRQEPDKGFECDGLVSVRVLANERVPGLAGARNTGILASDADFVAFCDDDDVWLPGKLDAQLRRLQAEPALDFLTTSIRVDFAGSSSDRRAGTSLVTHEQLLASRMAMLHSSTFLIRRSALCGELGLVDEEAPASQNEDWELLLRASRRAPIGHVDEPLVAVRWGRTSLFARAWESKVAAAKWILAKFPDIERSRIGYARLAGQIAFAYAALHSRREAWRWAARSLRTRWTEPRAYLALLVTAGVPASVVLERLHRRGHGV